MSTTRDVTGFDELLQPAERVILPRPPEKLLAYIEGSPQGPIEPMFSMEISEAGADNFARSLPGFAVMALQNLTAPADDRDGVTVVIIEPDRVRLRTMFGLDIEVALPAYPDPEGEKVFDVAIVPREEFDHQVVELRYVEFANHNARVYFHKPQETGIISTPMAHRPNVPHNQLEKTVVAMIVEDVLDSELFA